MQVIVINIFRPENTGTHELEKFDLCDPKVELLYYYSFLFLLFNLNSKFELDLVLV